MIRCVRHDYAKYLYTYIFIYEYLLLLFAHHVFAFIVWRVFVTKRQTNKWRRRANGRVFWLISMNADSLKILVWYFLGQDGNFWWLRKLKASLINRRQTFGAIIKHSSTFLIFSSVDDCSTPTINECILNDYLNFKKISMIYDIRMKCAFVSNISNCSNMFSRKLVFLQTHEFLIQTFLNNSVNCISGYD